MFWKYNSFKILTGIGDHNRFRSSCLGPLVLLPLSAFNLFDIPIYRLHVPYEVHSINASWTLNLISTWDVHDFI